MVPVHVMRVLVVSTNRKMAHLRVLIVPLASTAIQSELRSARIVPLEPSQARSNPAHAAIAQLVNTTPIPHLRFVKHVCQGNTQVPTALFNVSIAQLAISAISLALPSATSVLRVNISL